jgi:hypothetical protein
VPHVSAHAPHELSEQHDRGHGDAPPPADRAIELFAVVLMALTTVLTAWSGYQAARWSGVQSEAFAHATATRIHAQEQTTRAGQLRIDDLLRFNGWLDARSAGDDDLARLHRRRFRPEFVPAFRAWLAQKPFTNPNAIPGPLYVPEYKLEQTARAAVLDREADHLFEKGTQAKEHDDRYILSTVFFAAVLFFAGISLRLDWRRLRVAVVGMAAVMLLCGFVFVATLPRLL